ncbi:MAG: T9SS type A sorting domain-containing protein [Flavobacteriales bacterium]|nr:MAG: T9SS type A sorting domain-containing protein [Flavobacteriales bacterium]
MSQGTFNVVQNYSLSIGSLDAGGAIGRSVYETATGYNVVGSAVVPGNLGKPFVTFFDTDGACVGQEQHYGASPYDYDHGYSDPVWSEDGLKKVVMTEFESGNFSYSRQILVAYNDLGDTAYTHSLIDTGYMGMRQTCILSDGRVAACGFSDPDSVPARALLLLADTLGQNVEAITYANTVMALGVRPLMPNGAVLSGFVAGVSDGLWVMRLDSAGNTLWRRNFGGSQHAYDNVSAIQTQDGGIVATGSFMPLPGSWNSPQWNYFRKWDINGNVQWSKQYNQAQDATTFDIEELPNGDLVASGSENTHWGLLIKLEPDGDLSWLRRYTYYTSNGSQHGLYDVEPTSDGGFVATGVSRQGVSDSLPGLQMVWLLKVDSAGCLVPGCGNIGVEEVALGLENALSVYPNPARDQAQVMLDLPQDLEVRGALQLVVVDGLGRTVLEVPVGNARTLQLELAGLAAGVHYVHLRDETRWLSGTKLVVE